MLPCKQRSLMFVTHFVKKCLETRENEQNVVLTSRKRSEIVRIFVLAMRRAGKGASGSNFV